MFCEIFAIHAVEAEELFGIDPKKPHGNVVADEPDLQHCVKGLRAYVVIQSLAEKVPKEMNILVAPIFLICEKPRLLIADNRGTGKIGGDFGSKPKNFFKCPNNCYPIFSLYPTVKVREEGERIDLS